MNKGLAMIYIGENELLDGKIREGFQAYENRLNIPSIVETTESQYHSMGLTRQQLEPYRWKGQPLLRKIILVHSEQGYGDTIFFSRFLLPLKQKKCTILLKVQSQLESLFSESFAFCKYLSPEVDHQLEFHSISSLASLPHYLQVKKAEPKGQYINPPLHHRHQAIVDGGAGKRKVGICWRSNVDAALSDVKSIELEGILRESEKMQGGEEVEYYSFQLEPSSDERNAFRENGITNLSDVINNFSDTAYFLSRMDQIISIDTSVAHLAAAIGKSTTVLLAGRREWRWREVGGRSQWYRSATVRHL